MILWHQHVQQDVALLSGYGVEVDGEIVFQHMQHVMDSLYDVPSSPLFSKQSSHPPDLSGPHPRVATSPLPVTPYSPGSAQRTEEGPSHKVVAPQSCDLLQVEGDRCVGVCFARDEGFYGVRNHSTKRIAVATGKHGIHYIDWDPVEEPRPARAYRALYDAFERKRWPSMNWLKDSSAHDRLGNPISMREVLGGPLKSHPTSSFFLSGCGEESVLLWQYGVGVPCAKFVIDTGRGFDPVHRLCWNETGDRMAAIGNGGLCGFWDVMSAHHTNAIGVSNWSRQVLTDALYLEPSPVHSGSVLATTGEDELGRGVFALWDTLAPPSSCRIAHLQYLHPITELITIPGTLLFVSAQDSGSIQAHDFRMLGGAEPQVLWSLNSIHDGPIQSLEVGWVPTDQDFHSWQLCIATGGRDGDICLVNDIREGGRLNQRLRRAHWKKSGQIAHLLMSGLKGNLGNVSVPPFGVQRTHPESATGVAVLDLDWCDEGLLTAGADGFVQLFSFTSQPPLHKS